MSKVLGALRVFALLVGIWAILFLVAHLAGVLPPFPWQLAADEAAPEADAGPDEGAADAGAPVAAVEPSADAGVAHAPAGGGADELAPLGDELPSYVACPPESLVPTLSVVRLFGDRPQIVVGCGRETHLLALADGEAALAPSRVATFQLDDEALRAEPEGAVAAAADVNADGRVDFVLGHLVPATRNAAQQGKLTLVPRDEHGGFDDPVTLAPIAVAALAAAGLDGAAGAELVALHQADRFGRRPSEAWVFAGGAAPSRSTRLDAGATARALQILDLDRDAQLDVVALGEGDPGGRVHFGSGDRRFPRTAPLVLAGAREATVGDLDGDGAEDLVVAGDSVRVVLARSNVEQIAVQALDVPSDASKVHVVDVDRDGRADLVAIVGDGVGVLAQTEPFRFESRPLLDVPLAAGRISALVVAQLGGDDSLDLVLLVDVPGDARGHELLVVRDAVAHVVANVAAEPTPIPDAPLTLQVELR